MKKKNVLVILTLLVAMFAFGGAALATEHIVEGTIVGIDGDDLLILNADGTISTVALGDDTYDHVIVQLLADYFGTSIIDVGDSLDELAALLENDGSITSIEPILDADDDVVGWNISFDGGNPVTYDDPELLAAISIALNDLSVEYDATNPDDLFVPDIGEQIEAYHDGEPPLGFGDLTKVYAIAAESLEACEEIALAVGEALDPTCAVTVEELAQMLLDGAEMDELFDLYFKPILLGVGHVRQALTGTGGFGDGSGGSVVCHIPSGDASKAHTLSVGADAVPSHLAHGDYVGGC